MSILWETRAPEQPIRLTPEQQACPHDTVEYLGHDALFRCTGPDDGCGAEMVIPEYEENLRLSVG